MTALRAAVYVRGHDAAPAALQKGSQIAERLTALPVRTQVTTLIASTLPFAELLSREFDIVYAVTSDPEDIAALYALRATIIWDMSTIDARCVPNEETDDSTHAAFRRAIACAETFVDVADEVANAIEDRFGLGVTSQSVERAIAAMTTRVAVVVGEGLGNMIYAMPMVSWLARRYGAPVDLVIHNRFDDAVHLFARCPDINVVYPGYEWLVGRRYEAVVSASTAAGGPLWFRAKEHVAANRKASFNEEGRFIPEVDLNFLHLPIDVCSEGWFDSEPARPFIRDTRYVFPDGNIVGIANGMKGGSWSKREWPYMPELVRLLTSSGFAVRSFGLPGEHVDGSEDLTGIPMRDAVRELSKCSFFIGHDGGLCHIAEAIGVPTLWIFGPTAIIKNGPVYAHSDIVSARLACSPCLYKADWKRCEAPICMTSITVETVWASFEALRQRLAINGYDASMRGLDGELLDYELGALERAGSIDEEPGYKRERIAIFGGFSTPLAAATAALLSSGDIQGACGLSAAATFAHPGDPALTLLNAVAEWAWNDAPIGSSVRHLQRESLESAFRSLVVANVAPADMLNLVRIVSRHALASPEGYKAALTVAIAAEHALTASLPQVRAIAVRLASFASGLLAKNDRARQPTLSLAKDDAVVWMNNLRRDGMAARQSRSNMDTDPSSPWDGVNPDLPARVRAFHSKIPLEIGGHRINLDPLAPVMILTPHYKFKDAAVGSLSNLVARHAQGLADLGLRSVIVTVGFQDLKEGAVFRDNTLLVQGHTQWSDADWRDAVARIAPSLVLSYAGIDSLLDLSDLGNTPILRVGVDGLTDCDGVSHVLGDAGKAAERDGAWFANRGTPDIFCDDLTFALYGGAELRPSVGRKKATLVLLNNSGSFKLMQYIARGMPDWSFNVLTHLTHRGIEKNIHSLSQSEFKAVAGTFGCLLQIGSRPANLCAEALSFLELGNTVVSPKSCSLEQAPLGLHVVTEPDRASAWISVLRELDRMVWTAAGV